MSSADFWVGPPADPDRYRLVSLLGGGGEGEVWDAVLQLSQEGRSRVAVKILPARPGDERELDGFGRLLRSLHHPGLVRVVEVFSGPALHRGGGADPASRANYVVMDHVAGMTLKEWCDENPDATAATRLGMLRTVASALDVMHSGSATNVPVAHGDVKPANIVVRSADGGTVLVDMGLARLSDGTGVAGFSAPYAAPELRQGLPVATPESDRFAFAVTTAQVLTGTPVPTGPDGWLDLAALAENLRRSPATMRRPLLVKHVLTALEAPPAARPTGLRIWLDSASESLSQVTNSPSGPSPQIPERPTVTDPMDGPQPPQPPSRRKKNRFAVFAGSVVALLTVAVIGLALLIGSPGGASPTPGSATAGGTAGSGTAPSAITDPAPTGTDGRAREAIYLTDIDVVEHGNASAGFNVSGSARVSGVQYGRAMSLSGKCSNSDGGDYWVDYDLGRSYSTFTTVVGLEDGSPAASRAAYTILADGKPISTGDLSLGQAIPVEVPVTGVLRLRLQMNDPSVLTDDCKVDKAKVSFADPKVAP